MLAFLFVDLTVSKGRKQNDHAAAFWPRGIYGTGYPELELFEKAAREIVYATNAGRKMNHSEFLREIDVFSELSDQEREKIRALIREETFPEGSVIFQENSVGDIIYIVKAGSVDIRKRGGESRKLTRLARLKRGEVLGEMSFFDEQPRSAEAISAGPGDAELLCIDKSDFNQLMNQDQALMIKFLRAIIRTIGLRLRYSDEILQRLLAAEHPYRSRA